jgi:hypothetical protein
VKLRQSIGLSIRLTSVLRESKTIKEEELKEYTYADCTLKFNEELELWESFDWNGGKIGEHLGIKPAHNVLRHLKLKGEGPWQK